MKTKGPPLRGTVWFVRVRDLGDKPFLVVSNNRRNAALPTVLAVRVTTSPKPDIPTIVRLPKDEPLAGSVLCDDILIIPTSNLRRPAGGVSKKSMERVDEGLRSALALGH